MYFSTVASVALLAGITHASAEPANAKPYMLNARMAMMPVAGMSLMRRDTSGYKPEETHCGSGNTCAEACGTGYAECPADDDLIHCFNPAAKQNCCSDGSGNSCDDGYYCTHDHAANTWCCPDNMGLAECAKAYSVTGGLVSVAATTAAPTTTTSATPTTSTSTTVVPTTTSAPVVTTTSTVAEATVTELDDSTTTVCPETSSTHSTAWYGGANSTIATYAPTQPGASAIPSAPSVPSGPGAPGAPGAPGSTGAPVPPVPSTISGAATSSVSALLVLAAGVMALL